MCMQWLDELTLLMLASVFRAPQGIHIPAKATCSRTSACHLLSSCVSALPQQPSASSGVQVMHIWDMVRHRQFQVAAAHQSRAGAGQRAPQ